MDARAANDMSEILHKHNIKWEVLKCVTGTVLEVYIIIIIELPKLSHKKVGCALSVFTTCPQVM